MTTPTSATLAPPGVRDALPPPSRTGRATTNGVVAFKDNIATEDSIALLYESVSVLLA